MHAAGAQAGDVLAGVHTALRHQQPVGRDERPQTQRRLEVRAEGAQVPVVDADEGGVDGERPVQLLLVVHLHQHVHVQVRGEPGELAQLRVAERRDDEEHAVGPDGAGLVHLVFVDDEVLAQDRETAGGPGGDEVFVGALEELAVGQHREARSPARLVAAGDRGRVEVLPDHARTRGGLLHLRDDARAPGADRLAERLRERADRRGPLDAPAQLPQRGPLGPLGDLARLVGENAAQNVGVLSHGAAPAATCA